ncbi:MAG: DUF2336 domain-containing protein [Xanthobacteraceae bacterium]
MSAQTSLIPELEEVVEHGTSERRAEALKRITAFFLDGASRFNEDHVSLFDDVFGRLIVETEPEVRAELSRQLAPVGNAPATVVRQFARDDDISIAGPILSQSRRLGESDLVDIAKTKSQAHLLAISGRSGIPEPVTDILVSRGDTTVVRRVVENQTSRLSEVTFSKLVDQAADDGVLAERVGLRPDIPPRLFRDLLLKAPELVQQRLFATALPEPKAEIRGVSANVATENGAKSGPRDYSAAQQAVGALRQAGKLDETAIVDFAQQQRHDEAVAALASLCAVPIEVVDRLTNGERPDPVLILCKAAGWGWPTVKAIISIRNGGKGATGHALDNAYTNFERLSPATAQRVMRFWQIRR